MGDITLSGTVERFLWNNTENGYCVFIIHLANTQSVTVTGHAPHVQIGQEVTVHGSFVTHPKFGKQFAATTCKPVVPTTITGLKKFLGSGIIKGIGKTYAERLVNYFGEATLSIIENNPARLKEVDGIGEKRIATILSGWQEHKGIADIMVFLQDKGISPAYAAKIYKKYRHDAIARVTENPYRLAEEVWGIGFKMADQIALRMGFETQSSQRVEAGILFAIKQASGQGHVYVELEELKKVISELLALDPDADQPIIKQAFLSLYQTDKIKLITREDNHFITLTSFYYTELGLAERIQKMSKYPAQHQYNIDELYQHVRLPKPHEPELSEQQQQGILACFQHKITIITGGPGTGKTTLVKKLLELLEKQKLRFKLAAPTGRAAKRLMESTHRFATTIHRLLAFDVSTMRFTHNEHNALPIDVLIVDEASMIDIFLAHALIKALPLTAHLILIGDSDQLPSVGAGNFLHDCIASNKIATIRLTQIFRQAKDSLIVLNAHRVNEGSFPLSHDPTARRDFIMVKEEDPETISIHLKRILFAELAKHNISANEAMVLVPMNRGIVGTQLLNQHLQELLNPTSIESIQRQNTLLKVGDKVMQIRNNYDKNVFNGDIGTIKQINKEDNEVIVTIDDKNIIYSFDELDELVLAYAISIHKSQGSEYPAVIIPLFMQHYTLLQRKLLYTAITRAKKLCVLIGQTKAIAIALNNNKDKGRVTFLQRYLQEEKI